ALGVHNYHGALGVLPPTRHDPRWTFFSVILPYIEQDAIYRQFNFNKNYYDATNAAARVQVVKIFLCPSRRGPGPDALSNPGDVQDNTTNPPVPGALSDYAVCAGSQVANGDTGAATESDYWWTPTSVNPGPPANGMFIRENSDSAGGSRTLKLTFA